MAAIEKVEKISQLNQDKLQVAFDHLVSNSDQQSMKGFEVVNPGVAAGNAQASQLSQAKASPASSTQAPISPIEHFSRTHQVTAIAETAPTQIVAKTQSSVAAIENAKERLQAPNLTLKGSMQQVLGEKLNGVSDDLSAAFSQKGLKVEGQNRLNPVVRFLDLLTQGQDKLMGLSAQLQNFADQGRNSLTPEKLLSLQLKTTSIQQELEFFTNVLNKSLESTKTIMNVQI